QRAFAHGHRDRLAGVDHLAAAHEAVGGVHRDGANLVVAQVEGHLEDQVVLLAAFDEGVGGGEGGVQGRQRGAFEAHVDDGTHDGGDRTEVFVRHFDSPYSTRR